MSLPTNSVTALTNVILAGNHCIIKKGKFSHTHYQALELELIPVYRKSAQGDFLSHPLAVSCNYFQLSLWPPSQLKNITVL